ncbi:MAG: bifunctional nuclease family protein [Parachlamydiales bacterium]|nr:bifunctional nuclease family protein [Parachlamydiales bacterium]
MLSELIQIKFHKIMQTRAYTIIILGTDEKKFAIYTEPTIGRILQLHLTSTDKPRPLTHDLLTMVLQGLKVSVKQVVINDIQDTTYFARLFVEQEINGMTHIVEIDARPSDCIAMALINNAPVYCTSAVLENSLQATEN